MRTEKSENFIERARIALLLGSVITYGFLAALERGDTAVSEVGQNVKALVSVGVARNWLVHHA